MTTHSGILAWEIPWTEKPGRLQSMRSQRRALRGIKDEQIKPVCEFLLQWSVSRKIFLSLKVPWPGYEHSSRNGRASSQRGRCPLRPRDRGGSVQG